MQGFHVQQNIPYLIKCAKDQKMVLDVPDTFKMWIHEGHNYGQQLFLFKPRAEGTYVIQNGKYKTVLKLPEGKVSLDQQVITGQQKNEKNQLWRLVPALNDLKYIGKRSYFIIHHNSGLMLSLKDGYTKKQTKVTVWTPVGHEAQVFILDQSSNFKK